MGGGTINIKANKLDALKLQSSTYGATLPALFGVTRIPGNMLWYGGFKAIPHTTTQRSGKGGGARVRTTTYTYTANVAMALCEGQILGIPRVWRGKDQYVGGLAPTQILTASEPYTVPGGGGAKTVANSSTWRCTVAVHYTASIDVGDGTNSGPVYLAEGVDYTVAAGVYTFGAQWAGTALTIEYQYLTGTLTQVGLSRLNLTMFSGAVGQPTWVVLATQFTAQAIPYSGMAYVAGANYDLGDDATIPNHNFEVQGRLAYHLGSSTPDVDPSLAAFAVLTDGRYGALFPPGRLNLKLWSSYCRAAGLLMSPALTEQLSAAEFLDRMAKLTNTAPIWSAGALKMMPFGDSVLTGNGATYTPNLTPVYDLTDAVFLPRSGGGEPVTITPRPMRDAKNHVRIEFLDRANDYNVSIAEAKDQADIDTTGLRSGDVIKAHWICDRAVADRVAQLVLQRALHVRNEFSFKLPWTFALLEPMDLVTITESYLGLAQQPARVISIDEADDGELEVVAEEFPYGVATSSLYGSQAGEGFAANFAAAPGSVAAPVIFEAPAELTTTGLEVYAAARGTDPNWGGCNVWVSLDGVGYQLAGTIYGGARYGALTGPIAGGNLAVQLVGGTDAQLVAASAADAAALVSLCYIGGATPEYLAHEGATLTGPGAYTLSGLVRAAYGTSSNTHAMNDPFVRVDASIGKSGPLGRDMVGKTLYFKFTSFNVYGGAEQALDEVTEYSYAITGYMLDRGPRTVGLSVAAVQLYARTTTLVPPAVATSGSATYTFAAGAITGQPAGWTLAVPGSELGGYLWLIQASASSTEDTDTIANTEWSAPILSARDGRDVKRITAIATRSVIAYNSAGAAKPEQDTAFSVAKQNTLAIPTWTLRTTDGARKPASTYLIGSGAKTNLLRWSEDWSNALWTATRASKSANQAYAPDGLLSADKLTEDTTASAIHFTQQSVTGLPSAATWCTFSVFLKKGARTWAQVNMIENNTGAGVYVDLANGVLGSTNTGASWAGTTATISDAGGGWWRVSVTAQKTTSGTQVNARILLATGNGGASYTGDGVSDLYLWGGQFETDTAASNYLPTTDAAVEGVLGDEVQLTVLNFDAARAGPSTPGITPTPGHWVQFQAGDDSQSTMLTAYNANTAIKGVLKRFYWNELESGATEGAAVYNFTEILSDLAWCAARGLKYAFMIVDKTFTTDSSNGANPLPAYLAHKALWYTGGDGGYMTLRWDTYVVARMKALISAAATAILGNANAATFEGIATQETAVGLSDTQLSSNGYSAAIYADYYIELCSYISIALPNRRYFWFFNYISGGQAEIDRVITESMAVGNMVAGGPDCWPTSAAGDALRRLTYPKYAAHKDEVGLHVGMSVPSYQQPTAVGAATPPYMSMNDVFLYARDTLHVNYVFWMWRATGTNNYPTHSVAAQTTHPTFNVEDLGGGGAIAGPSSAGVILTAHATDGVPLSSNASLIAVTDGTGGAGSDGMNSAILYAYKRAASAPTDNPGAVEYTFGTASWSPANGWSKTPPAGTTPLYVVTAVAYSVDPLDYIAATEWSSPTLLVQDGADGLSAFLSVPSIGIACDAAGVPVAGAFNNAVGQVTVFAGATNVTSSCTFSATASSVTGSVNTALNTPVTGAKGSYRITALSAEAGYLEITATYNGVSAVLRFNVNKVRAGAASAYAQDTTINAISSGTYAQISDVISVAAGTGGTLRCSAGVDYDTNPDTGTSPSAATIKVQYRPAGGTWADFPSASATGTGAYYVPGDLSWTPGGAVISEKTTTGPASPTVYEFKLMGLTSGVTLNVFQGALYGAWA